MATLGFVLGVARSALAAQQNAIQTAGHNLANAETVGYSRQRVELVPNFERRETTGSVGTGVVVEDVRRARDVLLDAAVRQENNGEAAASARKELLAAIEEVVGEPSDTGLANALDALWSSWSDLATAPTSRAARSVVVERAGTAADLLNTFDERLARIREQTSLRVDNTLVEVNGLASRIAELNGRIVATEVGGARTANDLRDQRDVAVDRLAQLVGATVDEGPQGGVQVVLGGYTLVNGIDAKALARTTDAHGRAAFSMSDAPNRAIRAVGGSGQVMLDFLNHDLQTVQDQLDATANGVARAVNAVHAAGRKADGTAPPPVFVDGTTGTFDASASAFTRPPAAGTVNARTISVNSALESDPALVTATSSAGRPADNDVALAMAALRTNASVAVGGTTVNVTFVLPDRRAAAGAPDLPATAPTTLADFYRGAGSALAVKVQDATGEAAVRATLAEQARGRRDSLTGVNVDEELTNLMRAQQAYAAAAKVVTAADEMMQVLLGMV